MAKEKQVEKPAAIIPMLQSDLIGIFLLGGAIGLIVWGLGMIFDRFIFDAYLCQGEISSQVSSQCSNAKNYAAAVAGLIGAMVALAGLIRLRVYRPLLVVIASMVSLWGIVQLSWDYNWSVGLLMTILFYALAFGLFGWVARIREFWISLFVIGVLVVAVRFALLT